MSSHTSVSLWKAGRVAGNFSGETSASFLLRSKWGSAGAADEDTDEDTDEDNKEAEGLGVDSVGGAKALGVAGVQVAMAAEGAGVAGTGAALGPGGGFGLTQRSETADASWATTASSRASCWAIAGAGGSSWAGAIESSNSSALEPSCVEPSAGGAGAEVEVVGDTVAAAEVAGVVLWVGRLERRFDMLGGLVFEPGLTGGYVGLYLSHSSTGSPQLGRKVGG